MRRTRGACRVSGADDKHVRRGSSRFHPRRVVDEGGVSGRRRERRVTRSSVERIQQVAADCSASIRALPFSRRIVFGFGGDSRVPRCVVEQAALPEALARSEVGHLLPLAMDEHAPFDAA